MATVSRVMRHHAFVVGTVQEWYGEEGWGVLRTPDGLSVFCHFSASLGTARCVQGNRCASTTTYRGRTAATLA
jgi:cold shock CspA family protein